MRWEVGYFQWLQNPRHLQDICPSYSWSLGGSPTGTQPGAALLTPLQPRATPRNWARQWAGKKGSRVGRKEGPVKSTNADAIYLQRQKKTLPISTLLLTLPLHGKHAHRQRGCTLAPARLWELIHLQGKPKQHFHRKASAGWWWRTGEARPAQPGCKTICSAAIPFLPSAPDLKFK